MAIRFKHILLIALLISAVHLTAVALGWYERTVWAVDGPLHFLGGILAAMVFLRLTQKPAQEQVRPLYAFFAILGATLAGSLLWELFEFSMLKLAPTFATQYKLYSTSPADLLSDLGFGAAGGLVLACIFIRKGQRPSPPPDS